MRVISLVFIAVWLAGIIGWVLNIVAIVHALADPITGMFLARCIGVIAAPLGAVLGYF